MKREMLNLNAENKPALQIPSPSQNNPDLNEGDIIGSDDSSSFLTHRIREMNTFEIAISNIQPINDPVLPSDQIMIAHDVSFTKIGEKSGLKLSNSQLFYPSQPPLLQQNGLV